MPSGVGGLAATAPDTGDGPEEQEEVEVVPSEEDVEVRGALGLGGHDAGVLGEVGAVDRVHRLRDARRVHDPGQLQTVEQLLDGGAIGDVAGGDRHPGGRPR